MVEVTVTLDDESLASLHELARRSGISPQQALRELIREDVAGEDVVAETHRTFQRVRRRPGKGAGRADEHVDGETRVASVPPHIARRLLR